MTTTIPGNVDWVKDVCTGNLGTVAQSGNALYYVGGYTFLRDSSDPNAQGVQIANSHLYRIDLSGNGTKNTGVIDLDDDFPNIVTPQRLPDSVPRTMWGNFFSYQAELHMFGGLQVSQPIYLANGSASLSPRVTIGDNVWSYDIKGEAWYSLSNAKNATTGLGTDVLGQAAKAQEVVSDKAWMYGGAVWTEQYQIGDQKAGESSNFTEMRDLLQSQVTQASPDEYFMEIVATNTSSTAQARAGVQAVMVFIPNVGAEGVLILLSGSLLGEEASLQAVDIYDIHTLKWYTQPTNAINGTFPQDRTEACAVVASASDGTSHNIYFYGGKYKTGTSFTPLSDIWVLSIPTFQWIPLSNNTEDVRVGHTCWNVNGHYMVTVKGTGQAPCDRYGGLQFFDMNTAQFTTRMQLGGKYSVPQQVTDFIGGSGSGGAYIVAPPNGAWADNGLRSLFKTNATTPPTENHSPTPSPDSTSGTSNSHRTVLLATLIPILLIILIVAVSFWFCRRKRRPALVELPPGTGTAAVAGDRKYYGELSSPDQAKSDMERSELEANFPPAAELPDAAKFTSMSPVSEDHYTDDVYETHQGVRT